MEFVEARKIGEVYNRTMIADRLREAGEACESCGEVYDLAIKYVREDAKSAHRVILCGRCR